MTSPTGVRIRLTAEGAVAEVGTVAAVLAGFSVDGVALTETIPAGSTPPFATGIVLAPWPNRVRDGRWLLDGEAQQLDLTEVERGNAIHGLLRNAEYAIRERSASALTLGALIPPQHGWPFLLDTWVRYDLAPDGITVTHGVTNAGARRAPFAVGAHPFFRIGAAPVEELVLTLNADEYIDVDERLLPIATRPVGGTRFDLRGGVPVGQLELDTAYAALHPVDRVVATLDAPDGGRLALWQDADFRWVQVFTTPAYPRDGALGTAIAIEAMTAPPEALNSGDGLIWLEPGASWQGSWGARYRA